MKITLKKGSYGTYLIEAKDGRDLLFQIDYEFPGLARDFGWDISEVKNSSQDNCDHNETDGTVPCSCGLTTTDFISSAQEYLDEHIGDKAEDPGYF